jgi:hypothetical protein
MKTGQYLPLEDLAVKLGFLTIRNVFAFFNDNFYMQKLRNGVFVSNKRADGWCLAGAMEYSVNLLIKIFISKEQSANFIKSRRDPSPILHIASG